jgi:hypothetical protein
MHDTPRDASYWWQRVAELHWEADQARDPEARRVLMDIAIVYARLAQRAAKLGSKHK